MITTLFNAVDLYILGFGFDQENCNHLQLKEAFTRELVPNMTTRRRLMFTNMGDENRLNKRVGRMLLDATMAPIMSRELVVEQYRGLTIYTIEKSIRNVYDAFLYDFED